MPAPNVATGQGRLRRRRRGGRVETRTGRVSDGGQRARGGGQQQPGRARRRRNANTNPLYNPAKQLGGRQLKRAARDLAALEFQPQQAALAREGAQIGAQGGALTQRASDYYLQLAREEQGTLDRLAAINSMIGGQVGQSGQQAQAAIAQSGEQAARLAAESAPGQQGIQINDRLAAETQAARNRAAGNQQNAQTAVGAGTQASAAFAQQAGAARGLQGGETLQRLANLVAAQQAENRGQQTQLAGQRASATRKNVLDLRQQGFENLVTQRGLDIKTSDLVAEVAQQRAEQDLARQRQREVARNNRRRSRLTRAQIRAQRRGQDITAETQRRGQDITAEQRRLDRQSRERIAAARQRYGARKNGGMDTDTRKTRTGITNAQTDIEMMLRDGRVPREFRADLEGTGLNRAPMNIDTARRIVMQLGAPPLVAQAAAELAKYGGLKPATAARLRRTGVKLPDGWLGTFAGPPTPR